MTFIERHHRERIVLVGVAMPPTTVDQAEASLDELSLLVDTAGADEVERVLQRRDAPDPATYVGRGKAQELRDIVLETGADTVICDGELSPGQLIQLEAERTELKEKSAKAPRNSSPLPVTIVRDD